MNVAILSGWHVHAEGYAKELQAIQGCHVAAVWDDNAERGRKFAEKLSCAFVPKLDDIWQDKNIDAVCVTCSTSQHAKVLRAAARAGKHIFTEKVLAPDEEDAQKVKKAVRESGVHFAISFPHLCRSELIAAKAMIDSGELGQITYARVRNVHNGAIADWLPAHFYNVEQCGGGAMIDLGAHPMYTLCWLLGQPEEIQSLFTYVTNKPVEDNAACLLRFGSGAIGISETGFVSVYNPYTLEVSGTKGCLLVRNDSLSAATNATGGEWVKRNDLPPSPPSPLHQWAAACMGQGTLGEEFGIKPAVTLTRVMEAAYKAQTRAKAVTL